MQNKKILAAFLTMTLMGSAQAAETEYCVVTNKNDVNVVKVGKADCNSMIKMNCTVGDNKADDKHAAILVPKGQCDKVKAGDFSDMTKAEADMIKSKLDMKKLDAQKQ